MTKTELLEQLQARFNADRYDDAAALLRDLRAGDAALSADGSIDYLLGRIFFYQERYDEAESAFRAAVAVAPGHFFAAFLLGRTCDLLGRNDEAARLYAACAALKPEEPQVADFTNDAVLRLPAPEEYEPYLEAVKARLHAPAPLPEVSIIILCYNKLDLTRRCLESVFRNTDRPTFEVIVLDNASVDDTPAWLETFGKRITYIHSGVNRGFVGGNNAAVRKARGEFLLFLNNDTEVTPGWLAELRKTFALFPAAGAAGSMLVYPDGTLQEAGGVIFNDASGWNYGKRQVTNGWHYLYSREVDYCSGAALMVRRDLFLALGMFDERFAPAYYEDTDLCFGVRRLGRKVLYCPTSMVAHHEGATAGRDTASGFKKFQTINAPKFQEKWKKELALQRPNDPALIHQAANRRTGKRVLIIDDLPPMPDRAAGSLRLYHTVRGMLDLGYQVTYAHLTSIAQQDPGQRHLRDLSLRGVEFIWFEYETWWDFRNSPQARPMIERQVRKLDLARRRFDLINICFWHIAGYFIDLLRAQAPDTPVIVDSMDLHYLRELRQAELTNDPALRKQAQATKKAELEVYRKADGVTTVTLEDRAALRKDLANKAVFIMTDVHEPVEQAPPFDGRTGFVFIGNFNHTPNEDAVLYFVQDIFPLIRQELPEAVFLIVGNNPTPRVRALTSESVHVTGWVPEVRPYLEKCRVEVVPLRYGAGNKGKVGEALAHGIPMVMTSIGAEGMKIVHGEQAFIADDARSFARCCVDLYRDREVWQRFSAKGREHVATLYSSELMRRRIAYLAGFATRRSFLSSRALAAPEPPALSIIVPAGEGQSAANMTLAALQSAAVERAEVLLPSAGDKKAAPVAEGARIVACDTNGVAESVNTALAAAFGQEFAVLRPGWAPAADFLKSTAGSSSAAPGGIFAALNQENRSPVVLLFPLAVRDSLGGFDDRFTSWDGAALDYLLRAKLASLPLSVAGAESLPNEGFPVACILSDADAALFRDKWGLSPAEAFSAPERAATRSLHWPISGDAFERQYDRAVTLLQDKEPARALDAIRSAIAVFHASERRINTLLFPQVLLKAAEIAEAAGASLESTRYLSDAADIAPGDEAAARAWTGYLASRGRRSDALAAAARHLRAAGKDPQAAESFLAEAAEASAAPAAAGPGMTSIVILTFNQLDCTRECVASIERHTPEPHEILFVDNGSTDGTVQWLRKLVADRRHYRLIENRTNLGFAKGCNQGIEAARGEYLLLLNNDVIVTNEWLSGMRECLDADPAIGIVGPLTNNISGPQKVPLPHYDPAQLDAFAAGFRSAHRRRRIPSRRVVGFCMLFRRALIERIGLLDESFGTGNFEDDDLCLRAALAGFENVIAGDVFIHHHGSRSFIGNRIDFGAAMGKNRKIFDAKWRLDIRSPQGARLVVVNALERGADLAREGRLDEAIQALVEGIKHAPGEAALYRGLAEILLHAKLPADALEALNSAPEAAGADRAMLEVRAYCLEALDRNDEAAALLARLRSLHGDSARACNLDGVLAFKAGDRGRAVECFRRARALDPSYGEAATNLGVIAWAAGDKTGGFRELEQGFILAPGAPDSGTTYHAAALDQGLLAQATERYREARALLPNDKRLALLELDALARLGRTEAALHAAQDALLAFGVDDGILAAARELRAAAGPLAIKRDGRASLSLCMIVKNEEAHLARCLASIRGVADELIIVDTGSTDRTRELCSLFGAQIVEFPWTDDFSAARNVSLDHASGDWILVLDADEAISPRDHQALRDIVRAKPKRTAYSLTTRNYSQDTHMQGWIANDGRYPAEEAGTGWYPSDKVRLFPRDDRIRFENPVHEFVDGAIARAGIAIRPLPVPVHHYGRFDRAKTQAKGEAYYQLGRKKLAERSTDAKALYELAVQAGELGKFGEAVELWQRLLSGKPDDAKALFNLSFAQLRLGNHREALAASKRALELDPALKEAVLNYANAELAVGDAALAVSALERTLAKTPQYPPALGLLAAALAVVGRRDRSLELLADLAKGGFDCVDFLHDLATTLTSTGRIPAALAVIDVAVGSNNVHKDTRSLLEQCGARSSAGATA